MLSLLQTSLTPVLVQVLSLTKVALISIFTQTTDLLVFYFFENNRIIKFDQLTKHANEFPQIFVGAYGKLYSSQHILIRLVEEWKF